MGGLAGAAGAGRLNEPVWLVGGDADLVVATEAPLVWLVSIDDPDARTRAEQVAIPASMLADVAASRDAGERLLRRRLAMLLLATASGCRGNQVEIAYTAAGAPAVAVPAGWHLSVAARWPDCAIGVARIRLGVDLERITDEPVSLDLLTLAEQAWLRQLPIADQPAAFAGCWAAKEAHAKWTGQPRRLDPAAIETADARFVTSQYGQTRCWRRRDGALAAAVSTAA